MQHRNNSQQPLVLLDVDGVINDLGALGGAHRPWETDVLISNEYRLHIPDYMRPLVFALDMYTEVWWCTTWRDRANNEIARHLGIENLPVVTDGSNSHFVDWKAAAARPLVEKTIAEGREVFWIEDFYEDPPIHELPEGVTFVDTTVKEPRGVLSVRDIPWTLRRYLPMWPWSPGHEIEPSTSNEGDTPWV